MRAGRGVAAVQTSVAATADAAGTASSLDTPPRGSCSRQVRGSVKEVDQESKWVTVWTERSDVFRLRTLPSPARATTTAPHDRLDAVPTAVVNDRHTIADLLR